MGFVHASRRDVLGGQDETEQLATGMAISANTAKQGHIIRVYSDVGVTEFRITRWD